MVYLFQTYKKNIMLPQGDFVLTNNRLSTQCERCGGWGCDWDDYRDYILAESGSSLFSRVVVRASEIQGSVVEASETGCAGGRAIIEVWHVMLRAVLKVLLKA